jgi:hypothetical protein
METVRIRDPGWKKVGSGINIPDPQYWLPPVPGEILFHSSSAEAKINSEQKERKIGSLGKIGSN